MNLINLNVAGWVDLPVSAAARIVEATVSDVILRRTGDDPETGPRAIVRPAAPRELTPGVAYSARVVQPMAGSGLRVHDALPLKDVRSGPAFDAFPITPDDDHDLEAPPDALYIVEAGDVAVVTLAGITRTIPVADHAILPVGVRRVLATGTSAAGIFGLV